MPRPSAVPPRFDVRSGVWSWLRNPQLSGVIIDVEPVNRTERVPVPHVLRVISRPDPLHHLAAVIAKERRRRGKAAAHHRIVVVASHIHTEHVVPPTPRRELFAAH